MGGRAGETLLQEAVAMTTRWGLVKGGDHIVCIEQVHDSFVIKIVSVDAEGNGISDIRPDSLNDLAKVLIPHLHFAWLRQANNWFCGRVMHQSKGEGSFERLLLALVGMTSRLHADQLALPSTPHFAWHRLRCCHRLYV